tara:strand:- start:668 stop:2563 length:1896 start_codon:yes stop_codon:yes gene_type:complete
MKKNLLITTFIISIILPQNILKVFENNDKEDMKIDSMRTAKVDSAEIFKDAIDSSMVIPEENSSNLNIISEEKSDTVLIKNTLFEQQIAEAHFLFAKGMVADHTGDTLKTIFNFKLLFESLAQVDEMNEMDEFEKITYNKLLDTAVNYFEKANTVNKAESGLSVALLRDKLDNFIYDQKLDDLEFVDETVEIIEGHIPITYNGKVHSIIKFFQNQGKVSIQNWLNRTNRFKKIILPILEEENVPPELFYLAMIESGLNPNAYSYAHASGVWQFISSTGKMYGLDRSYHIDERLDFEKSTRAAATYLKDLYAEFDDWYLAFAAYNSGSGRVRKAIKRHGTRDYWKLYSLPKETRNYVPNIMAAIFISKNPEKYGFTPNPLPDLEWNIKELNKSVSVKQISECSNISVKELRFYNPELKHGIVPPLKENEIYKFRLPVNASENFDSLFALIEIANDEVFNIKSHRVKYGENLSLIAKNYQVPMKDIISYNKISNPDRIKPKTYLQIPINYELYLQQEANKRKKIYHTVKRGDTVSEIAELYKTSAKNIKKWNGLRTDVIRLGQKLEIWVKATSITNYTLKKKSSRTYKVRYGDTLSEIAEKYGIGLSKIKKWNNINSSDDIREGQILKISPPY